MPCASSRTVSAPRPHALGRVVLGAVVDDENLVHRQLGQPVEHDLERLPAVPGDDDRRNARALGFRSALGPHDKQVYVRTMRCTVRALPPLALAFHGVADVPLRRDPQGLFVSPGGAAAAPHEAPGSGATGSSPSASWRRLPRAAARRATRRSPSTTASSDNLETLVPLLREEEVPATVFVVSGWLGEPYPWADGRGS